MKANWITIVACGALLSVSAACENNANRSSATEDDRMEQSDSTYMENQEYMEGDVNNGQPGTDEEGGNVNETQNSIESGYGSGNGTELDPRRSGTTSGDGTTEDSDQN